ncbi:MAG: hypothetical protein L0332_27860 [Chloroflexi bacterium]|nr:hypothetical protein [Chloroflexota bacterium]MCI0649807.1 hypothetical protein [Chloroflexota bacterium]MCI0730516.1 hypothetical protein [Chloroflexota bacterium]
MCHIGNYNDSGRIVGGPAAGEANVIANNGIHNGRVETNVIRLPVQNQIRDNTSLAINLGNKGLNRNDSRTL